MHWNFHFVNFSSPSHHKFMSSSQIEQIIRYELSSFDFTININNITHVCLNSHLISFTQHFSLTLTKSEYAMKSGGRKQKKTLIQSPGSLWRVIKGIHEDNFRNALQRHIVTTRVSLLFNYLPTLFNYWPGMPPRMFHWKGHFPVK